MLPVAVSKVLSCDLFASVEFENVMDSKQGSMHYKSSKSFRMKIISMKKK